MVSNSRSENLYEFGVYFGFSKGDFEDINKLNNYLNHNFQKDFNYGISGGLLFDRTISKTFGLTFDISYEYFQSYNKIEFRSVQLESLGEKKFPLYLAKVLPVLGGIYYKHYLMALEFKYKFEIGYSFCWYEIHYPNYNADWFDESFYKYNGGSPALKIGVQILYSISEKVKISIFPNYRFIKIKKLELYDKKEGGFYTSTNILINKNGDKTNLNISGFSINLGVNF